MENGSFLYGKSTLKTEILTPKEMIHYKNKGKKTQSVTYCTWEWYDAKPGVLTHFTYMKY